MHGTLGLRPIALRQPERGRTRQLAVEAVVVYDDGVGRTIALRGWELETQPFLQADGSAHVAVRARKGSRVIGRLWPAQQEDYGISEMARKIEARYRFDRGGKFFAALRGLVKQLNFARAGGMRPWAKSLPDTVGPIPYSIVGAAGGTTVKTSAVLNRCMLKPYSFSAPPMSPEVAAAIRAGAKVSVPRETPDGRWVCDVEL